MDAKRFVVGTLVGGVVLYVVGELIFTVAFAAFYAANVGSATGVDRSGELVWAVALGSLAYAALVMFAIGNRGGALSIGAGVKVGAIVGFLVWCTADFTLYGITNIANLTRTIVDPLLEIVHGGIGGAVVGFVLSKMPASGARRA
jgi:uncharacterized membrane protein